MRIGEVVHEKKHVLSRACRLDDQHRTPTAADRADSGIIMTGAKRVNFAPAGAWGGANEVGRESRRETNKFYVFARRQQTWFAPAPECAERSAPAHPLRNPPSWPRSPGVKGRGSSRRAGREGDSRRGEGGDSHRLGGVCVWERPQRRAHARTHLICRQVARARSSAIVSGSISSTCARRQRRLDIKR